MLPVLMLPVLMLPALMLPVLMLPVLCLYHTFYGILTISILTYLSRATSAVLRSFCEPRSADPEDLDVLQVQVRQFGTLRFETPVAEAAAHAMSPYPALL
jgi:hypothetical protein